jgi:hypothetical protein
VPEPDRRAERAAQQSAPGVGSARECECGKWQ